MFPWKSHTSFQWLQEERSKWNRPVFLGITRHGVRFVAQAQSCVTEWHSHLPRSLEWADPVNLWARSVSRSSHRSWLKHVTDWNKLACRFSEGLPLQGDYCGTKKLHSDRRPNASITHMLTTKSPTSDITGYHYSGQAAGGGAKDAIFISNHQ